MDKLLDYFTAQRPRRKEYQRGFDKSTVRQKAPKPSHGTQAKLEDQVCTMKKIKTFKDTHTPTRTPPPPPLPPTTKADHSRQHC